MADLLSGNFMANDEAVSLAGQIANLLADMPDAEKVATINECRRALHDVSPFKQEPVDFVEWVPNTYVEANDYNPNSVAPPEMELLAHSIHQDGYTQPIVSYELESDKREVVDGFHRHRVGRENPVVNRRVMSYLPVVSIKSSQQGRNDRIASTIRHNRARGKHKVEAMSDIVIELKRRNWTNERVARELGMDQDEVLRLCQITGLAEMFNDTDFSKAWDVEGHVSPDDFEGVDDNVDEYDEAITKTRTVNTSDNGRVFHTYDKWECHKAGFYDTTRKGMTKAEGEKAMADLLADIPAFCDAMQGVIDTWKNSCEHYLTNLAMNRIAWMGQAAACYAKGVPSAFRGGWSQLTAEQQDEANASALEYINKWMVKTGREAITAEDAMPHRESEIY